MADIPGLIEGAAEGAGIGDRFLGHVERTKLLVHLIDADGGDPAKAYEIVRDELAAYGADLDEKDEILCLSRADTVDKDVLDIAIGELERVAGVKPLVISAMTSEGIDPLLDAIIRKLPERVVPKTTDDETEDEKGWSPL